MTEKHNSEQKTLATPPDSMEFAPTIRIKSDKIEIPGTEIQETRKGVGCSVIAVMCISLATGGSIATLGYQYINKKFPFAPDSSAGVTQTEASGVPSGSASAESSDNTDIPETIRSNQDLKNALQIHKIKATAKDFDFETGRAELQAKAVFLLPQETPDSSTGSQFRWRPVRERITRTDQKELLVAVKIINPNVGANAFRLIVPEGLNYRARTMDEKDPSIMYFYYNCQDKKTEASLLAQIGIKDPVHPKKLMWARSFMLPVCE